MPPAGYYTRRASIADFETDGRCVERLFARHIISLLPKLSSSKSIHDYGCGPTVFTEELMASMSANRLSELSYPRIVATSRRKASTEITKHLATVNEWTKVKTWYADPMNLPFADETFDFTICNLEINKLESPVKGAAEIYRTLRFGGMAYITAWNYHGILNLMSRLNNKVRPNERLEQSLYKRGLGVSRERLEDTIVAAGFARRDVEVHEHRELLNFESEEKLVELMCVGTFAAEVTKKWKESERDAIPSAIKQVLSSGESILMAISVDSWVVIARKT